MSAVQLNFSLRTSSNVKTVHLLGSWDNYNGQLPLSKDSSKKGGWKGTFRFQGSVVQKGQRYWYYYIVDGYHVSHDPAQSSTKEPTTGRTLNILDVPGGKTSSKESSRRARQSVDVPKGRPLSQSQIKCPKPERPGQTRYLYDTERVEELATRLGSVHVDDGRYYSTSPSSSVGSSLSSRSSRSGSSSPSSASSFSDYSSPASSNCSCERYGITRKGDRVKLDCGGSRCGYSDSDCSSDSDSELVSRSARRHGMVIRG